MLPWNLHWQRIRAAYPDLTPPVFLHFYLPLIHRIAAPCLAGRPFFLYLFTSSLCFFSLRHLGSVLPLAPISKLSSTHDSLPRRGATGSAPGSCASGWLTHRHTHIQQSGVWFWQYWLASTFCKEQTWCIHNLNFHKLKLKLKLWLQTY